MILQARQRAHSHGMLCDQDSRKGVDELTPNDSLQQRETTMQLERPQLEVPFKANLSSTMHAMLRRIPRFHSLLMCPFYYKFDYLALVELTFYHPTPSTRSRFCSYFLRFD
eukprot:6000425-Amphidinium_carterae.1